MRQGYPNLYYKEREKYRGKHNFVDTKSKRIKESIGNVKQANCGKDKIGHRRGNGKPMLQKKIESQKATLGDPGQAVDMIQAKGQKHAAEYKAYAVF